MYMQVLFLKSGPFFRIDLSSTGMHKVSLPVKGLEGGRVSSYQKGLKSKKEIRKFHKYM